MTEERSILVAGSGELLRGAVPIQAGRVASRRILKAPGVRVVRVALDSTQVLAEHTAAVPVLVQVLSGDVVVDVDGEPTRLPEGGILYIAAQAPHSVEALAKSQLTLTLLDGFEAVHLGQGGAGPTRRPASRAQQQPTTTHEPAVPSAGSLVGHVVLASSGADAAAVDAFTHRHAELAGTLASYSSRLLEAAASDDEPALVDARDRLISWAHGVLAAHFALEAGTLFPAVDEADGVELVATLRSLLDRIGSLLQTLAEQSDAAELAACAVSLRVTVDRLLRTETDRLLPLLAGSPRHSLAQLWAQVERGAHGIPLHGSHAEPPSTAAVCECGILDDDVLPELDVRTVPHAIRHATVFGALEAIAPGGGMVLVASHDPLPLLAQIQQRTPDRFEVSYLQRGPDDWRLRFVRSASTAA